MALGTGSTLNPGRTVAWPLIVGGGVLAVAWSGWQMASGRDAVDVISVAASGLAGYAVAVICVTVAISLLARLGAWLGANHPRFLTLDFLVPVCALLGFLVGWAAWK